MYGFRGHRLGPKSGNYKEVNFRPPGELETTQGVTGEEADEWGARGGFSPLEGLRGCLDDGRVGWGVAGTVRIPVGPSEEC